MSTERTLSSRLEGRVDGSMRMAGVAAGDLVVILGVIVVGVFNHSGLRGATDPLTVADAAVPFLVGWGVAALVVGAYRERALVGTRHVVLVTLGTWVLADLVGQGLRATPWFGGNASVVFFLVLLLFGGGALTLWRTLASRR